MNEVMLLKLLDEIDSMSLEKYREFFNESQKLPDSLLGCEPIPAMTAIDSQDSYSYASVENTAKLELSHN